MDKRVRLARLGALDVAAVAVTVLAVSEDAFVRERTIPLSPPATDQR
jgi:hypothetical protein